MAVIRLAVSCLNDHQTLAVAAVPFVVKAYAQFGVNLVVQRFTLETDPVDARGWRDVMAQLRAATEAAGGPVPPLAHLVLAVVPPNFDTSINGQLLDRMRGICAVYLGASSFRVPTLDEKLALVIQVMIHEIGHMLDLVHDFTLGSGYSEAMLSTSDRLMQPAAQAWDLAIAKAQQRGEALQRPDPILYYPFGDLCRACLFDAATNKKWWPWHSAFRGDFGGAAESADVSMRVSFVNDGPLRSSVGDGVYFTLRLENCGVHPIAMPAHIGPEFGSMSIEIRRQGNRKKLLYIPESYRCSSARQDVPAGAVVFKSFSFVPHPEIPMFTSPGEFELRVSLWGPYPSGRLLLGAAKINVVVRAVAGSRPARNVAVALVASARSNENLPTEAQFGRLHRINADSAVAAHARYKLALLHEGKVRHRLLEESMGAGVPTAIRHRAARQHMLNVLRQQGDVEAVTADLRTRFNRAEDVELHGSLQQMEDGWKLLAK